MSWHTGTATDYRDLLDQLIQNASGRHCSAAAINAAGTGYVVGDLLGIDNTGSTRTHDVSIEVMAVGGGGEVTSARIASAGAYTVDPTTTTGNASTGGTGTGATFNLTFAATGWAVQRRTQEALSAVVGTAGTGYNVADQLTIVLSPGGLQGDGGVTAVFQVATTVGGPGTGVATVSLVTAGNYEETPTNDAATTTGGGGSGCELTVTYQPAVTQDDQVAIISGTAPGAVDPIVGVKLWQGSNIAATATTYNWSMFGMTSYSASVEMQNQANFSPGLLPDGSPIVLNGGAIVPLKDSDAFNIEWWFSITGRRIMGVAKVESPSTAFYMSFHLGLLNQLGTTAEFQYPLYVCGSTNRLTAWYQDTNAVLSGLTELVGSAAGGASAPGYLWYPEGAEWLLVVNAQVSSDTDLNPTPTNSTDNQGVYPAFRGSVQPDQGDKITTGTGGFDWRDIIWDDLAGALEVFGAPGAGDVLVPCIVLRADVSAAPDVFVKMGEIEGLFWTSAAGGQSSEDDILIGTTRHRIFQNGNRVQTYSYCAMRED